MLEYKLAMEGIRLVMVKETFSSQCSPLSEKVCKTYAVKNNRKYRGLYTDGNYIWNADAVGVYNILRLYFYTIKKVPDFKPEHLSNPLKVAV